MSIKGVSYAFLMCHIDSPTGCLTSSVIDFKATESLNEAKGAEGGVFPKNAVHPKYPSKWCYFTCCRKGRPGLRDVFIDNPGQSQMSGKLGSETGFPCGDRGVAVPVDSSWILKPSR